jgi:CheY-like chemotaxis protein
MIISYDSSDQSKRYRILLVDDYTNGRETMADILMCWGYDVTSVSSGASAIEHIGQDRYDLVISNLTDTPRIDALYSTRLDSLPDMSNMELLGEVKRYSELLPVILVAPNGSDNLDREARQRGAIDHIRWPIRLEDLRSRIQSILDTVRTN